MYFHVCILICAFVIQVDTILLTMKYLYFVFSLYGNTQLCFYLPSYIVNVSMKSEWNESCTESISYIQVNSSIIKDQIGVFKCFG